MKNKPRLKITFIIVLIMTLALTVNIIISNTAIKTTEYTLECDKLTEPVRIVLLSDLHSCTYGNGNERLISAVKSQEPDLIFMTGDMVNADDTDFDVAASLVSNLKDTAPVYFSMGNHEEALSADIAGIIADAGAKVLDFEYEDVTVNGQRLRIGGVYGYCTSDELDSTFAKNPDNKFMKEFQKTDDCKLLLCHNPASWIHDSTLGYWDVDFVFGGHFHGGQIVLPFVGGVYGIDLGFFPGRLKGVFCASQKDNRLIVSAGLGTHTVLRVNNRPELAVTNLTPKTE